MQLPKLIQRIYQIQVARYKKKGFFNSCLAFVLLYVVIVGGQKLGQYLWPSQIQDKEFFTMISSFLIHFFCQLAYFLIYLPGYLDVIPFYKNYLINKQMIPPWKRPNWPQMKVRTIRFLFLNQAVVYPLLIYLSMKISGIKVRFQDFPSALQVFVQLQIIMYIEDFFFFWYHKLSHDFKLLYKFHKVHHQYDYVFSLATQYTHPVDYIFGILIPSALPFIILSSRAHCFMLLFWQVWKIFISSQGHCGYEFPWSSARIMPFVSGPSYHDFHHSKNMGNFAGSIYLWDTINSSNNIYMDNFGSQHQVVIRNFSLTFYSIQLNHIDIGLICAISVIIIFLYKLMDTIKRIGQVQLAKYRKKGFVNTFISFFLLFAIIFGGQIIGQKIWPQNIQDQGLFTVKMSFIIHISIQFAAFLIYLPGYLGKIPYYQKYLINKQKTPPWKRSNWKQMKRRTFIYLFINQVIAYPLIIYLSMRFSGFKVRFQDFPSPLQILFQMLLITYIEDFFTFWYHKTSHQVNFLYKFHKIHHQYDYVYSLVTQYTHPVDYFFAILVPPAIAFMILGSRVHCFMLLFWQVWKIFQSSQGHSGYQFPWTPTRALPFGIGSSYHDFHHSKNVGNFAGSLHIWDTIVSTNRIYMDELIKQSHSQKGQKCKQNMESQKKE